VPDKWLRVRGARALAKEGGGVLRTRTVRGGFDNASLIRPPPDDGPTSDWRDVAAWGPEDTFLPVTAPGHAFAFTDNGTAVYALTSKGADYVRLVKVRGGANMRGKGERERGETSRGQRERERGETRRGMRERGEREGKRGVG
jgi:hypothetical protein